MVKEGAMLEGGRTKMDFLSRWKMSWIWTCYKKKKVIQSDSDDGCPETPETATCATFLQHSASRDVVGATFVSCSDE